MPGYKPIKVFAGSVALLLIAAACSAEQSRETPQHDETIVAGTLQVSPTPTATPILASTPTPTPTAIIIPISGPRVSVGGRDDPPTVQVDLAELDASQILDLAQERFARSDSYLAEVTTTNLFDDGTRLVTHSSVAVGPDQLAQGTETRDGKKIDLLYVKGFSYERPTSPPDQQWFATGRKMLDAVTRLGDAIARMGGNPEIVETYEENGKTMIEIAGSFHTGSSGPPPTSFKRSMDNSAAIVIDAERMLPVSIDINYVFENRHIETDELLFVFGFETTATVSLYGQVVVEAEHPRNLVPTPVPTAEVATPTPTPTSQSG